jgi:uncharacterized protein YeaO (DUF488 family)
MAGHPNLRRVYEQPLPGDGMRILVDRVWPRSLTRDAVRVDEWMQDVPMSHRVVPAVRPALRP